MTVHCLSMSRSIYLLSPKALSPEVIAVTFAKTSRSPESFREIAAELTEAKSAEFHEKWVVGYGHASVAEHAVLHIAFENVSRLAIECLESNRLASYTEKSTRYQMWTPESFYTPPEIAASPHAALYTATCQRLFDTYLRVLGPLKALMQQRFPRKEGESEARWEGRLRSKYVDNARFLLPASALANVGLTANARVLESAIRKLRSHPLAEVRELGAELKQVAQGEVPTLVKYAEAVPYQRDTAAALEQAARNVLAEWGRRLIPQFGVELLQYDAAAEAKLLSACLARYGEGRYEDYRAAVEVLSAAKKEALLREALGRLEKHDVPLRELEHLTYTVEATMDQGAYFEWKRHRLMTQSPQRLTTRLGYAVPRAFEDAGLRAEYDAAMQAAHAAYATLVADCPEAASYVVPNGFNRRVLMTFNLRQAFHLCELRGAPNAHFSVRRVAGQLYAALAQVHPALTAYMRCQEYPHWQAIENEYFVATH